ncbi:MAG: ferritin-like domain-containing protein [Gemmatimonadaceae bacterium]
MALDSLKDLYVEQLRDLYSAENQILKALPKMAEQARHPELQEGFRLHVRQTEEHVRRLEQIFQSLGERPGGVTCEGMKGLVKEGEKTLKERADSDVLDAAMIADAQRVEHYEIAGYGCVRTYANMLGRQDDAALLQRTLDEEGQTDQKLTQLAERVVNLDAAKGDREVSRGAFAEGGAMGGAPTRRSPGTSSGGDVSAR